VRWNRIVPPQQSELLLLSRGELLILIEEDVGSAFAEQRLSVLQGEKLQELGGDVRIADRTRSESGLDDDSPSSWLGPKLAKDRSVASDQFEYGRFSSMNWSTADRSTQEMEFVVERNAHGDDGKEGL